MKTFGTLLIALLLALPVAHAYDEESFSQAELDQMLAPVALYPDTVLSHILIAATYPLEVVQAARWVRQNPGLEGERAVLAVEPMDWDPSVKALAAFPNLLLRMDEDLDWTRRLGDAFLAQEAQMVATIQELRQRAYRAGHLASSEHVAVVHRQETILIEPAHRHIVYVPYYDPWVVYGPWWHPAYPPVYWTHPLHGSVGVVYWSYGVRLSPTFSHVRFLWPQRQLVIIDRHHRSPPKRWAHDPRHRKGIAYRTARSAPMTGSARGFVGAQTLHARPGESHASRTQRTQRDWAAERRDTLRFNTGPATRSDHRPGGGSHNHERDRRRDGAHEGSRPRAVSPRQPAPAQQPGIAPAPRQGASLPRQGTREAQPATRSRIEHGRITPRPSDPAPRPGTRQHSTPQRATPAPLPSRPSAADRQQRPISSGNTARPTPPATTPQRNAPPRAMAAPSASDRIAPRRIPGPPRTQAPYRQSQPEVRTPRNPGGSARAQERGRGDR